MIGWHTKIHMLINPFFAITSAKDGEQIKMFLGLAT
jgi:hypothetical protein